MPFFKAAVLPVANGYSILIWVCLFAARTACLRHGFDLSADPLGKMPWALAGQLVGHRGCDCRVSLKDFMEEGVGSIFPTSVELEFKTIDETHGLCVDLEPISPSPCSSHALRLFQVKFQVTSGFP